MAKNVLQKHWNGTAWVELHPITKASNVIGAGGRNIAEQLADIAINVKSEHGAIGDGVSDDTSAIQAALLNASTNKRPVFFPAGAYKIGQITIPDGNLDIFGAGWGVTTIIPLAANQTLFFREQTGITGSDNLTNNRVTFRDLAFSDPNGLGGCRAVYGQDVFGFNFLNVLFRELSKAVEFNRGGNINLKNILYYKGGRFIFDAYPHRAIAPSTYDYCKSINIDTVVDLLGYSNLGGAAWWTFRDCVNIQMSNVQSPALMGNAIGISIEGKTEGFWANNVILVWPTIGVRLVGADVETESGVVTVRPEYTKMIGVAVDQSSSHAFIIRGDYTNMVGCIAANGRLRGTGQGILIQSPARYLNITQTLVRDMASNGIGIESGARDIRVSQSDIYDNATTTGTQVNAVLVRPFDVVFRDCNITGAVSVTGSRIVGGNTSPIVHRNTGSVATTAVTTAEDLMTYTIPAGTLKVGQRVRLKAFGNFAANANTKTLRMWYGGLNAGGWAGATNGADWQIEVEVEITTATTQEYTRQSLVQGNGASIGRATGTIDNEAAVIVKLQGQNGTASAGDIVCEGFSVEIIS